MFIVLLYFIISYHILSSLYMIKYIFILSYYKIYIYIITLYNIIFYHILLTNLNPIDVPTTPLLPWILTILNVIYCTSYTVRHILTSYTVCIWRPFLHTSKSLSIVSNVLTVLVPNLYVSIRGTLIIVETINTWFVIFRGQVESWDF